MLRMIGHFYRLLDRFAAEPKRRLSDLPLLSAAESQQLLREWNDAGMPYREARCLHELIAAQADKSPERVAVVHASERLT
jgi:non-ribosomal peptide synthetase component F